MSSRAEIIDNTPLLPFGCITGALLAFTISLKEQGLATSSDKCLLALLVFTLVLCLLGLAGIWTIGMSSSVTPSIGRAH